MNQHPREFTALPLMPHQRAALRRAWGRKGFALLAEQGTGKTLVFLAEALALYAEGKIDALLVLAPNGVHQNWVLTEVPVSVPAAAPCVAAYYASAPTRKERAALDRLMTVRGVGEVPSLRILAMSYDALLTAAGFRFAETFVQSARAMVVADECFAAGTMIETPNGKISIECLQIGQSISTSEGAKSITNVFRHKAKSLVKVELSNGTTIQCTPDHLFWTKNGWCKAKCTTGRALLRLTDVRSVPDRIWLQQDLVEVQETGKVLQQELLLEMDAKSPCPIRKTLSSTQTAWRVGQENWRMASATRSIDAARSDREDGSDKTRRWRSIQEWRAWWQWLRTYTNRAAAIFSACQRLAAEFCNYNKAAFRQWFPAKLQSGFCLANSENCIGSGWRESQFQEGESARCKETSPIGEIRVVCVESQEQRGEADVWDIEVEDVHHYFAGGVLVHNSHRLKNPSASRTKRALNIARHCAIRRIGTGTAIANSPLDAFSQFEFLGEGLLGETSFTAFRAQYAVLLPPGHGLLRHILARKERALGRKLSPLEQERLAPAIIEQDAAGRPKYKNLPHLHSFIAEHSFRVLKEDCLDLPPKTYETLYFHLTKAQRAVYDRMENELRYILDDGTLLTTTRLVALGKLLQITSGFLLMRDGSVSYMEDNPRTELLAEQLEDETRHGIIWSQFREEQRSIARVMREAEQTCEMVNGGVSMKRRREIISEFQAGNLQWINAHPETLGSGFTLTAGTLNYYYSNGYNMVQRIQSEDRTHRKGTSDTVLYRDFVAIDTRDDNVVWALQHKLDTAAMVQGDPERESRFGNRERKEDTT